MRQKLYLALITLIFSLAAGCIQECNSKKTVNVTIYNAGVAGSNSEQGLKRFDSDVLVKEASIVVIGFGMNDAVNSHNSVNIEDFQNNISEMVQRCHHGNIKVILNTINPVTETELYKRHQESFYADHGGANEKIKAYNKVIRKIASERKVPVADYYKAIEKADFPVVSKDGVHPTPAGSKLLADVVEEQLRKIISDNDVIVCIGDSITRRGYPEIIQESFGMMDCTQPEIAFTGNTK